MIVDWTRPLFEGGLGPGSGSAMLKRTLQLAAYAHGFDLDTPFEKMPAATQNLVLYGISSVERRQRRWRPREQNQRKRATKGFRFPGIMDFWNAISRNRTRIRTASG